ncbi:MAG: hypothetical protein JXA22_04810 [Candidatus Thermoplasmatota archaeon]|nr:hypothetical protein [Candidatus Thermoplasmatota archaeon]
MMLLAGTGLIVLMTWTLYRIRAHRNKMRNFDETAMEIGRMHHEEKETARSAPTLPESDLLIVMFRSRGRPWRGAVTSKMERGAKVLVVSPRPPAEVRTMYPKRPVHIWLDRSTAHDVPEGTFVINPTNLSSILEEIRSAFPIGGRGGIVVFEGFEDVLSNNAIDRMIRFLKMLQNISRERGISSVVPLPYKAVPQRVRNQLVDGFQSVVID